MKYLRSLMQQSVTACKNQAKLIQQFTLSFLKSASNLNGNLNCSKELEHYAS